MKRLLSYEELRDLYIENEPPEGEETELEEVVRLAKQRMIWKLLSPTEIQQLNSSLEHRYYDSFGV